MYSLETRLGHKLKFFLYRQKDYNTNLSASFIETENKLIPNQNKVHRQEVRTRSEVHV